MTLPPVPKVELSDSAPTVEVLEPPDEEAPGEFGEMQIDAEMHFEEPGEVESSAGASSSTAVKRKTITPTMDSGSAVSIDDEEMPRVPPVPVNWEPKGHTAI